MDRRGFIRSIVATVALTTGLARTSFGLSDGAGFESEAISSELTMSLDAFSKMYIQPAMKALAANIDQDILHAI